MSFVQDSADLMSSYSNIFIGKLKSRKNLNKAFKLAKIAARYGSEEAIYDLDNFQ